MQSYMCKISEKILKNPIIDKCTRSHMYGWVTMVYIILNVYYICIIYIYNIIYNILDVLYIHYL